MEDMDIYIQEPEPWERQLNESPQAFEAFAKYRDMGAARSTAKVSKELCKSVTLMNRWSAEHNWVKRAAAWDAEKDRTARAAQIQDILDMRKRHAATAQKMMKLADEALEHIRPDDATVNEISRLVETASKLERISRGDVGDVIEERAGEAVPAVQIYVPDNNRGKKDTFDDLEVKHERTEPEHDSPGHHPEAGEAEQDLPSR